MTTKNDPKLYRCEKTGYWTVETSGSVGEPEWRVFSDLSDAVMVLVATVRAEEKQERNEALIEKAGHCRPPTKPPPPPPPPMHKAFCPRGGSNDPGKPPDVGSSCVKYFRKADPPCPPPPPPPPPPTKREAANAEEDGRSLWPNGATDRDGDWLEDEL